MLQGPLKEWCIVGPLRGVNNWILLKKKEDINLVQRRMHTQPNILRGSKWLVHLGGIQG